MVVVGFGLVEGSIMVVVVVVVGRFVGRVETEKGEIGSRC